MQLAQIVLYQTDVHLAKGCQGGLGVVSMGLVRYLSIEGSLSKVDKLIPRILNLSQGGIGACCKIFNVNIVTLENQPEILSRSSLKRDEDEDSPRLFKSVSTFMLYTTPGLIILTGSKQNKHGFSANEKYSPFCEFFQKRDVTLSHPLEITFVDEIFQGNIPDSVA
jgi:hypothetical protein